MICSSWCGLWLDPSVVSVGDSLQISFHQRLQSVVSLTSKPEMEDTIMIITAPYCYYGQHGQEYITIHTNCVWLKQLLLNLKLVSSTEYMMSVTFSVLKIGFLIDHFLKMKVKLKKINLNLNKKRTFR